MKAADRTEWCQIVSMRWTPTGIEPMDLDNDEVDLIYMQHAHAPFIMSQNSYYQRTAEG